MQTKCCCRSSIPFLKTSLAACKEEGFNSGLAGFIEDTATGLKEEDAS